ncbi:MAG: hypothetical protein WED11_10250, partial [Natronospirillum sp.]
MAVALALVISTVMLRWQRFGGAVYPIADALAKRRHWQPIRSALLAIAVSALLLVLSGWLVDPSFPVALGLPGQTLMA